MFCLSGKLRPGHTSFVFSQSSGLWSFSDLLFFNDFSLDSSIDNINKLGYNWSVLNGVLKPTATGENRALFNNTSGTDYNIKVNAAFSTRGTQNGYGIYYRATEGATDKAAISGYCFQFDPGSNNQFLVRKWINGSENFKSIAYVDMKSVMGNNFDINVPHSIEIEVVGNQHVITVDGVKVLNFNDNTFTTGSVGVRTWGSVAKTEFTEVAVTDR